MGIRRVSAVALVPIVTAVALVSTAPPAAADEPVRYEPPVDAPVVDPFRPPANRYGPGNRGLTYDLVPGTAVHASADGEVVFAGQVGGELHVTVLHPDGLRTSYSFLDSVGVRRGDQVQAGDVVGAAGVGFHLGAREGSTYIDPAQLFGGLEVRVRLIPHEEVLPPTDDGLLRERLALAEVVDERNALQRFADRVISGATRSAELLRAGYHVYDQLDPIGSAFDSWDTFYDGLGDECTAEGSAPAVSAAGRIALLVAGYGSDSARAGIDGLHTADLGYRPGDVLRHSYTGGRVPDPDLVLDPALVGIPAHPYEGSDTFGDLRTQGSALADLVQQVAEARPGASIDLYAHSQGGIVTRLALLELADRPGGLAALGTVVTIGTPHAGADLATLGVILKDHKRDSVDFVTGLVGADVDTRAMSVRQMAETSELIRDLADAGVPDGVDFRTIGARGDLVVTGDKTTVPGHPSVMLDLFGPAAHNDLPASSATTREIRLALSGAAPSCRGMFDRVLDAVVPEAVSFGENAGGAGFLIG